VLRQLGISVPLAENAVTKVDIPPTEAGSYTMTCGMGMMSGTLVVRGAAGETRGLASPLLWLALTFVGTVAALYVARNREIAAKASGADGVNVLGLTPVQLVLVVGGMAIALIAGLAFGGFFS
jgi:hypothetical protein